ncbi:BglII/BstYI family type II restriction endonuclease [Erythrobacter sp. HL-111]|uniref:BglII/BstYI family type II restriction endonuclease n=1 Tax=Erythrobacter sp. HL-111 TaxID=1798193 RepID=UPI0006DA86FC|nr:BglII/BstYI family type II restriction endonuclease [Erythrobacter sp. HL-111]KPP83644.1 MAG: Restriction endonuclease BglII [Erythrobacteraceae bacterium HL-111]SDS83545.1 Restriction endonuclease BglII [Erythrobacter sp. HL-111]
MTDDSLSAELDKLKHITTEDDIPSGLLPAGFIKKYETKSYRNAANLLWSAHQAEAKQLFDLLNGFEILMEDILKPGGNKSQIAKKLEAQLHPLDWIETRISGDLLVRKRGKALNRAKKSPKFLNVDESSIIRNFLDGHQIDFVKGRVAFDLEWNSKDQTFDRDLYAMRAFYECGIIDVGIILTRSTNLASMFADIASRVDQSKSFKDKYGASTTWMGKLDYRINAGRAGGCPILALGFQDAAFVELEDWRKNNRIIDGSITADSLIDEGDVQE